MTTTRSRDTSPALSVTASSNTSRSYSATGASVVMLALAVVEPTDHGLPTGEMRASDTHQRPAVAAG
jgi:hypothetical protein